MLFTSPSTFGRRELQLKEAKYAFLGVPYDSTESYRIGSRFAPNAIRESSREIEDYDMLEEFDLLSIKICDCGDVDVSYGNFNETLDRTKGAVKEILSSGAVPVVVGGEHTVSYCVLSAYKKNPFYLVFDAHLDFRDEYLNERFSHACVVRRIGELIGYENILLIGARSASKEEYKDAKDLGLRYISFGEYKKNPAAFQKALANEIPRKDVYLSVDMDVLDPRDARGVCNPEPPGFSYEGLLEILNFLKAVKLVGFDLTEVSPLYDSYTQILAAKLIFKVLLKCEKR